MNNAFSFFASVVREIHDGGVSPSTSLEAIVARNGNLAYIDDRKNYGSPLVQTVIKKLKGNEGDELIGRFVLGQRPNRSKFIIELFPGIERVRSWDAFVASIDSLAEKRKVKAFQAARQKMIKILTSEDTEKANALLSAVFGFPFATKSDNFPDFMFSSSFINGELSDGSILELKDSAGSNISSFNSTLPTQWKTLKEIEAINGTEIVSKVARVIDYPHSNQPGYLTRLRRCFYFVRTCKGSPKVKTSIIDGSFFETLPKSNLFSEVFKGIVEEHTGEELSPDMKAIFDRVNDQSIIARSRGNIHANVNGTEKFASISPRLRVMSEVTSDGNPHNYPEIVEGSFNLITQVSLSRERNAEYQSRRLSLIQKMASVLENITKRRCPVIDTTERLQAGNLTIGINEIVHNRNGLHLVFQYLPT